MRFLKNLFSVALCCLLILAIAPVVSAQSVTLKWKFKKGQAFQVESTQTIDMVQSFAGQTMSTKTDATTWTDWDVTGDEGEGVVSVETTIRRMKSQTEAAGRIIKVDTKDGVAEGMGASQMLEQFKPLIDKSMTMKVAPNGKMVDLKMPEDVGDAADALMGPQTRDMLKATTENSLLEFPNKPLSEGDSWEKVIKSPTPAGEMKVVNTYKYLGVAEVDGKKYHHIDVDIKMDFVGNDSISIDEQETNGSIYFDSEAGRMHSSEVNQKVKMNVSANGQTITQTLNQKAKGTFTLKK